MKIEPKRITACEIDQEALNFCVSEFGADPLYSQESLKNVQFTKKYNLIWVGSLVTHIKETAFRELLEALFEILDNDGVLVFTTHGQYSVEKPTNYEVIFPPKEKLSRILKKQGYFFTPYDHSQNYGISICTKDYVENLAKQLFGERLRLLRYQYRGWDNHQDVYSFQKISSV